ncbi:bifunctional diguanylate cyclase/phosphodiesterase [Planomonospora sp. ID82291]|uniref:putative bifunctional diguanylate cyclase/phosphodiesterase n=1 Tax=Planomonospora sp. ID82291 TaxID=2738136 RepID=UPI0018C441F4|nr:GGDEF domain-containing phosphodiesterase [Planomonospora sp. ID82291]MBG0818620.1 EAL domain-containing protein [Planomonospora sp. ID82291]
MTADRRPRWPIFLAGGLLVSVAGPLLPGEGADIAVRSVVSVAAVIAMIAGTRLHRPAAPAAWRLLIAGLAAWVGADLLWTGWFLTAGGDGHPVPFWLEAAYLPAYPLLFAGLGRLPGNAIRSRNVGVTLDAMVILLGAAFVYWTVSFNPYGNLQAMSGHALLMAAAYPVAGLFPQFMAVRLWFTHGLRNRSYAMLVLGVLGLYVNDVLYFLDIQIGEGWSYGLLANAGWLLWFVLMGTAALHPSMADARSTASDGHLTVARGVAFLVMACAGPVSLIITIPAGTPVDPLDFTAPMIMFIGLMGFLTIRLITNAGAAHRRALLLDEQAAELQRALAEQSALQELVSHRAMHDPLTGLANRALFNDRLEQATVRRSPAARHALLLLDLDGFKHVNDGYGHPVGDQLLIQAGRRLREIVREADTLARFGGDEFAVLLEDVTAEEAGEIAGRVVDVIAEAFTVGGYALHVTTSVGLYMIAESVPAGDVLRDADLALYAAKAAGKNQISVFHPGLRVERLDQARIAEGLRRALEHDAFSVDYQPVVDLRTGAVHAVEALLRWSASEGVVPPDAFIPTAEETGLIVPIGARVLRRACFDARRWHERYGIAVTVNVSAVQLRRPDFVATVLDALADSGLPGEALILEITETALLDTGMQRSDQAIEYLFALRGHGVRVAIDDFGTGYSSLAYLHRLPVDVVKIDGAFTTLTSGTDVASRQRHAFTRAILGLCESLDLPAVAEKVETAEQEEFLRGMRCPLGQGYLFSKPVPPATLDRFLAGGTGAGAGAAGSAGTAEGPGGSADPIGGERLAG